MSPSILERNQGSASRCTRSKTGRSRGASVKRSTASPGQWRLTEAAARAASAMYFSAPVATRITPQEAGHRAPQAAPAAMARNFWLDSSSSS